MKYESGIFKPKNASKWLLSAASLDDSHQLVYRSSYEKKFYQFLDDSDYVKYISVEPFSIPYISIDNKQHRYYPDCLIRTNDNKTIMVEIKPMGKVKLKAKSVSDEMLKEFDINQRKWHAARMMCKEKLWRFCIITENELNSNLTNVLKNV